MEAFKTIEEFVSGERIYGHFLVVYVEPRFTQDYRKSEFLIITLMDMSGTIAAKRFDCTEIDKEKCVVGNIVYATGIVSEYNGTYLKVEHLDVAPKELKLTDFVPSAPHSPEIMLEYIMGKIQTISDDDIRRVILWMLEAVGPDLMTHPAAKKMHHAILSGLLFHIMTMLQVAEGMYTIYPWLNRDLLTFGIVGHDVEKVHEMVAKNGIASDYTAEGFMLGHITMGVLLVERAFQDLDINNEELKMVLQHLILSHHEKPEWGSPVKPMLPEAVMLHMIDNIDAKMYAINAVMRKTKGDGKFSEPIPALDGRKMYRYNHLK